jgi:hypothetical protein
VVASWLPGATLPKVGADGAPRNLLRRNQNFGAPEEIRTPDPQIRSFQGPILPGSRQFAIRRLCFPIPLIPEEKLTILNLTLTLTLRFFLPPNA